MSMPDRPLSYLEAAAHFGLPERTFRALVAKHQLRTLRAGRRVLFDVVAILHLTEAMRAEGTRRRLKSNPEPATSGSPAPSAATVSARLQKLLAPNPPKKPARQGSKSFIAKPTVRRQRASGSHKPSSPD